MFFNRVNDPLFRHGPSERTWKHPLPASAQGMCVSSMEMVYRIQEYRTYIDRFASNWNERKRNFTFTRALCLVVYGSTASPKHRKRQRRRSRIEKTKMGRDSISVEKKRTKTKSGGRSSTITSSNRSKQNTKLKINIVEQQERAVAVNEREPKFIHKTKSLRKQRKKNNEKTIFHFRNKIKISSPSAKQ